MGCVMVGVCGMKFKIDEDCLFLVLVVVLGKFVFVVIDGGYVKCIVVEEYCVQGCGGIGIKVVKLNDDWGIFVGGLIVFEDDEVLVVLFSGKVVCFVVVEVFVKGCDIMGVVFVCMMEVDCIFVIVCNGECGFVEDEVEVDVEFEVFQMIEIFEDIDV